MFAVLRKPLASAGALCARAMHVCGRLPYAEDALAPTLSARAVRRTRAVEVHLVEELNTALKGSALEHRPLNEIVAACALDAALVREYTAAAEVWNRAFFWRQLVPGGKAPPDELLRWVARDFGSLEGLETQLRARARGVFGAGWAWLALDRETLRLHAFTSCGATHPLAVGLKPLLALSLWEHAYMWDYGTRRDEYVGALLRLVDWPALHTELVAAADAADDHAKLKYLVRLGRADMRKLQHELVERGTLDVQTTPSLSKLGLLGGADVAAAESQLDAAMREVAAEEAAAAAVARQ